MIRPTLVPFDQNDQIRYANTYGEDRVSRGHPRPITRGRGHSVPKLFGTPYLRAYGLTWSDTFGSIKHVRRGVFLGGHVATCHSKVTQPQRPSYCLEHYTHAHAQTGAHYMRNRKQTLCGDRTRWQENFYRVDDAPPVSKSFVTWMLTRDLFVVADLIVLTTFYERIVNADMYISCVSSPKYNSVFCIWSTLWTNYFVLVIEILLKTAFFKFCISNTFCKTFWTCYWVDAVWTTTFNNMDAWE